jgi:hypothetical protein
LKADQQITSRSHQHPQKPPGVFIASRGHGDIALVLPSWQLGTCCTADDAKRGDMWCVVLLKAEMSLKCLLFVLFNRCVCVSRGGGGASH